MEKSWIDDEKIYRVYQNMLGVKMSILHERIRSGAISLIQMSRFILTIFCTRRRPINETEVEGP